MSSFPPLLRQTDHGTFPRGLRALSGLRRWSRARARWGGGVQDPELPGVVAGHKQASAGVERGACELAAFGHFRVVDLKQTWTILSKFNFFSGRGN